LVLAFAASFLVGAWGFSDAAPGDLLRTNNSGGNQTLVPKIAGTPCWRLGSQTFRPDGVAFSACTPTTSTTTTVAATTTPTTSTTTTPATSSTSTSSTLPASTTTTPGNAQFVETFDGNSGLDRFRWGVYNRGVNHVEAGTPEPTDGVNNNVGAVGDWTGDHDIACGDAMTQRPLEVTWQQDTTGANGWMPHIDTNIEQMVYVCRDHVMSSMGDVSAFTVLWFAPAQGLADANQVSFDVNLTDLGGRPWWKVGIVSDELWQSTYATVDGVVVPGFVVSDVGSSNLNASLQGPDRMFATWSGAGSGGEHGGMKIGNHPPSGFSAANADKMTRLPVSFTDNGDGTVTFTVNGISTTQAGSFPDCPCYVVFLDQNYNPDKDGALIGHTWHWDSIVVI
jgi:hypothetical protein